VTRIVLDIDDSRWKVDHLARVMRTAESEFLSELAAQVEIQVADARPLIVLDTNALSAWRIADIIRSNGYAGVADQIEAQTKPARIPEPGLWGVVEASLTDRTLRRHLVHLMTPTISVWVWTDPQMSSSARYGWDDLINPTLIREGVS